MPDVPDVPDVPDPPATLADSIAFAQKAHGEQTRKGKDVPYISHLMQVAGLVLEHGGDLELAQAGVLHDTLEDCPEVSVEELRARFGERVARVASECSDLLPGDSHDDKSAWEERKPEFLARLARADRDVHLVVACDKLHNLRDLVADLRREGAASLERFSASPGQTRWYYEQVLATLDRDLPEALRRELSDLLATLASFVPRSSELP